MISQRRFERRTSAFRKTLFAWHWLWQHGFGRLVAFAQNFGAADDWSHLFLKSLLIVSDLGRLTVGFDDRDCVV